MLTTKRTLMQMEIGRCVVKSDKLFARAERCLAQGKLDKAMELIAQAQQAIDTAKEIKAAIARTPDVNKLIEVELPA